MHKRCIRHGWSVWGKSRSTLFISPKGCLSSPTTVVDKTWRISTISRPFCRPMERRMNVAPQNVPGLQPHERYPTHKVLFIPEGFGVDSAQLLSALEAAFSQHAYGTVLHDRVVSVTLSAAPAGSCGRNIMMPSTFPMWWCVPVLAFPKPSVRLPCRVWSCRPSIFPPAWAAW